MAFILTVFIRLGLGMIFIISGGSKFKRARSVEKMIANYRLLPRAFLPLAKRTLAPAEMGVGLLLVASLWLPVYGLAWTLAAGLLLIFSFALASALARGLVIPCNCGLLLNGHVITPRTLGRNLALLSLLALDLTVRRSLAP